jgi:hypothetical protein
MTSSILPTKDDDNGTIVGTVLMSKPAVGMAALTRMTAMGDLRRATTGAGDSELGKEFLPAAHG